MYPFFSLRLLSLSIQPFLRSYPTFTVLGSYLHIYFILFMFIYRVSLSPISLQVLITTFLSLFIRFWDIITIQNCFNCLVHLPGLSLLPLTSQLLSPFTQQFHAFIFIKRFLGSSLNLADFKVVSPFSSDRFLPPFITFISVQQSLDSCLNLILVYVLSLIRVFTSKRHGILS